MRPLLLAVFLALTGAATPAPAPARAEVALDLASPLFIRVNAAAVLPASSARVLEEREDKKLTGILLEFRVDRGELARLLPPAFDMNVDGVTLLSFDPARPVVVSARARPELVRDVAARLPDGQPLSSLAATPGASGFPMLFDLENYRFHGVIQETAVP